MTRTIPERDANGVMRPHPVLGLVERQRVDGSKYAVAVLGEDLLLPAGTEVHLRRVARTAEEARDYGGAMFALPIIPPAAKWKATPRLDGSAIRLHAEQETHQ